MGFPINPADGNLIIFPLLFHSLHFHFCVHTTTTNQIHPQRTSSFLLFLCKACYLLSCPRYFSYLAVINIWYAKGQCKIHPIKICFPNLTPKYKISMIFPLISWLILSCQVVSTTPHFHYAQDFLYQMTSLFYCLKTRNSKSYLNVATPE